jgi:hypothetical protein
VPTARTTSGTDKDASSTTGALANPDNRPGNTASNTAASTADANSLDSSSPSPRCADTDANEYARIRRFRSERGHSA